MKLQAGNPNLMKINKSVGLGTFAQTAGDRGLSKVRGKYVPVERDSNLMNKAPFDNLIGDKAHAKYRTGFVPTAKDPNAVPAPAMSVWKQPVYVVEKVQPMRPGADDHLKFKSVGNLT